MLPEALQQRRLPVFMSQQTFVFCLAMASLAIALAHRTFHVSSTMSAVVQSEAPYAKVQHLSNDAHHWILPELGALLPLLSKAKRYLAREQGLSLSADNERWIECRPPPVC